MQILVDKLALGESCQGPMLRSVTQGRWDMLESIAISSRPSMSASLSQIALAGLCPVQLELS